MCQSATFVFVLCVSCQRFVVFGFCRFDHIVPLRCSSFGGCMRNVSLVCCVLLCFPETNCWFHCSFCSGGVPIGGLVVVSCFAASFNNDVQ